MTTPIDIASSFYDALGRGDVPAILSLLDPQVEWTEAERFPYYGGTWHGPQAVLANLIVPLSGEWNGFSAKAHDFIAEGDRVVALGTYSGPLRRLDDHSRLLLRTSGPCAAARLRGSTCIPTRPRCSRHWPIDRIPDRAMT